MSRVSLTPDELTESLIADISVYEPPEEEFSFSSLESFSEGDIVEYSDGNLGVVVSKVTESFDWPSPDGEDSTVEASSEKPVYIVARETGGSQPFRADALKSHDGSISDKDPNPKKLADDADLATIYYRIDDPSNLDQFRAEYEELINVPGVEDPGAGFDSWPDSWEKADEPARAIALDAWASMGGTWRGCYSEIGSKRICSAFKDEILGTEEWRGKF